MSQFSLDIGATPLTSGVHFRVWAPAVTTMEVELPESGGLRFPLQRDGEYFEAVVQASAGDRYWFWLDGTLRRPDPASRTSLMACMARHNCLTRFFPGKIAVGREFPLKPASSTNCMSGHSPLKAPLRLRSPGLTT